MSDREDVTPQGIYFLRPSFHWSAWVSYIHVFFSFSAQDMENMSEEDGWEFVNLGDQQSFGIKTAGLEEKATACQMLVSGPNTTNGGFT